MKKGTVIATTGAVVLAVGLLIPTTALAQTSEGTFFDRVAEKMGISSAEMESVREEVRVEMHTEREIVIDQALEDGDLTDRQYEILSAKEEFRGEPGEMRGQQNKGSMFESLNESGLDVTHEEMQELHEALQDLGFTGGPKRGMHR